MADIPGKNSRDKDTEFDGKQVPATPLDAQQLKQLGDYEIIGELGKGGMGIVYRARQKSLDRHVALKVLPPVVATDKSYTKRFENEARASADLHHPNITAIYEFGREGDLYFIAMEYVKGKTFEYIIQDEKIPLKEKLRVLIQVAQGMYYAHRKGLVHRDIKPSNIMVTLEDRVFVMDFGLAHWGRETTEIDSDAEIGTPGYLAPEQAQSEDVDKRADIYSLGAVLYDVLAFHKRPLRINHRAPNDIEAVCLRAMEFNRDNRYPDMEEFYSDIERYLRNEPVEARSQSIAKKTFKKIMKYKGVSLVTAALVLVVALFGSYYASQRMIERSRWKLIYEDTFDRGSVGLGWQALLNLQAARKHLPVDLDEPGSPWHIEDGRLMLDYGSETLLLCRKKFTGDLRMECEYTILDSNTHGACFLMYGNGSLPKDIHNSGYSARLGLSRLQLNLFKKERKFLEEPTSR